MPRPMLDRNRLSPEGSADRPRALVVRAGVFLLPDAREAVVVRVGALLRLREGEDARVAMVEG